MNLKGLARQLENPSLNRAEKVRLLRNARLGRDDLILFPFRFPPTRRFTRRLTKTEVIDLLEDAGYNVGQAVMEALEEEGSFKRTGFYKTDRRGRRVPVYRLVEEWEGWNDAQRRALEN
jgi:hypothetical protein